MHLDATGREAAHWISHSEHTRFNRHRHDSNVQQDTAVRRNTTHKRTNRLCVRCRSADHAEPNNNDDSGGGGDNNNIHLPPEGRRRLGKKGGGEWKGKEENASLKPDERERNKVSGRLRVGGTFAPVHQRFHFLFFHTDVVDCGPLHCRRLLVLLHVIVVVVVVVLKGIWTRRRCFIGHSEADNMGGGGGTVRNGLFTCTHYIHTQIHTHKPAGGGGWKNVSQFTHSNGDEVKQLCHLLLNHWQTSAFFLRKDAQNAKWWFIFLRVSDRS